MGKQTKNFRQSNRSMSGSKGASNFGQQNRGAWHQRLITYISTRGKGEQDGQSH